MKKNAQGLLLAGFVLCALGNPGHAMLIDAGNGLINDTDQTLVWTQDANLFKTQYDADNGIVTDIINTVGSVDGHTLVAGDFNTTSGSMTWWGAMAWADWLDYGG